MVTLKRLAAIAAVAGTATLGACSDALSPDTVDPQALSGNLNTLAASFENNAAFQSMRLLAPSFPAYGASALLRASLDAVTTTGRLSADAPRARAAATRLLASLRSPGGIDVLFPADVLGRTLVWDSDSAKYVVSNVAGAPPNGIRIILYVANPLTGQPFGPTPQPIGNLDLTDESSPAANKLGVLLRLGGLTLADYDITATVTTTSVTLRAQGYVRSGDGTQQVDFDISLSVTVSSVNINVVVEGSDGTVIRVDVEAGATSASVDFSVHHSNNTIAVSVVESSSNTVAGTISFNGTVVATITGPADDPAVVAVDGFTLTPADVATLEALFINLGDLLTDLLEGILAPGAIVFGGTFG